MFPSSKLFSHGAGWDHLTAPVVEAIERYGCKVQQIKEKFGGLRIYSTLPEDEVDRELLLSLIDEAETVSMETCEFCGSPGFIRGDLPWWKTLCDLHYEERKARYATL